MFSLSSDLFLQETEKEGTPVRVHAGKKDGFGYGYAEYEDGTLIDVTMIPLERNAVPKITSAIKRRPAADFGAEVTKLLSPEEEEEEDEGEGLSRVCYLERGYLEAGMSQADFV